MIRPFGEAALLVELDDARAAQELAASLLREPIAGVVEAVPGLASLLVELDPIEADALAVASAIEARLATPSPVAAVPRRRTVPVVYGGDHGPDLRSVAELCGLTEAQVIELHAGTELRVLFDGFAPGFAYLGDLPEPMRVPRLATPRTHTAPGSVAVTDAMSGIYPADLPGGWRVIGRTPITLFDPRRDPPAYLVPGDAVRFEPIAASEWGARSGAPDDWG